jgi:hypothetical protein
MGKFIRDQLGAAGWLMQTEKVQPDSASSEEFHIAIRLNSGELSVPEQYRIV